MARPMHSPPRRTLFLRPRRKASLASMYLALLALALASVAGLVAVLWPRDAPHGSRAPASYEATSADPGSPPRGLLVSPAPPPRHPGNWM